MKLGLALYSVAALAGLVGVSIWATGHVSIVPAIQEVLHRPGEGNTPWLVATLFDAYFAFGWFWLWIAYKEPSWFSRGLWLVLVGLTGNMAMAAYMLIQLFKLPPNPTAADLLLRRP